jgi:RNA polymerase sigma-70 factor (ECF subfamily)
VSAAGASASGAPAPDDTALMRRIARGDTRAIDTLVRRHLPRALRLARRVLGSDEAAEDVAQEGFLRLWKHAPVWKSSTEAGALFSTWLYRVILNLCIDQKRKRRDASLDDLPEPADARANAETQLARREMAARVRRSVAALPERQRLAFILSFYEEHSNKEAADILGVSVKAVESLLVRARRQLGHDLSAEKIS